VAMLAAAYAAAPARRPVRQLQGLDLRSGQLPAREFWYTHTGEQDSLKMLREAIENWKQE